MENKIVDYIYGEFELEDVLIELINCDAVQRLKHIHQVGATYLIKEELNVNRLEHSIGVMLLIRLLGGSLKEQIAGLLHDISHTAFSHVIDFFNNDAETQTSTEINTKRYIERSDTIQDILKRYGLETDDVADYSRYSIADNESPRLSADRLEYSLYMGTARGLINMETAENIFNDLIIVKNEDNEDEMCFKTIDLAKKFTRSGTK